MESKHIRTGSHKWFVKIIAGSEERKAIAANVRRFFLRDPVEAGLAMVPKNPLACAGINRHQASSRSEAEETHKSIFPHPYCTSSKNGHNSSYSLFT